MRITVNGQPTEIGDGVTVAGFIRERKLDPGKIVVELNMAILEPGAWERTAFRENDTMEVLTFMGGG